MRGARVWAGLLGLQNTLVERVEFDEQQNVLVVSVRPGGASVAAAATVPDDVRAMTKVRDGAAGGPSTSARS